MDNLEKYRQIVQNVLLPFIELKYANGNFENKVVFDRENNRYLVISEGWEKNGVRYHGCLLNLEIIGGKIWIQEDNTDYGIATDLEENGVPKSDIVLGFQPPEIRPFTEYAVA